MRSLPKALTAASAAIMLSIAIPVADAERSDPPLHLQVAEPPGLVVHLPSSATGVPNGLASTGWSTVHQAFSEAQLLAYAAEQRRKQHRPRPVVLTAAAPSAGQGVEQWRGLVAKYFPASEVENALVVIECESRGDPLARNRRSSASGLLQFIDGTWRSARTRVAGAEVYARAFHAPPEIQIAVGAAWLAATSWGQWQCAGKHGIR